MLFFFVVQPRGVGLDFPGGGIRISPPQAVALNGLPWCLLDMKLC